MASFTENFFSIVILGRMNPSILNHDFLMKHEIIPRNIEPFSLLLQKPLGEQFTEFVSTPLMSNIRYAHLNILVEPERLQALDQSGKNPSDSPIPQMVRKYFGLLQHTPVKLGGFNFRGNLRFDDRIDEQKFDETMGANYSKVVELTKSSDSRVSTQVRWPYENGVALFQVNKPKGMNSESSIQFNFEFEYTGNMTSFLAKFDLIEQCHDEFKRILFALEVI